MADPRDPRARKDPASAPIPYIATDLPPGRTVAALCDAIWEAEARFGLLDWEVNGVKPWQAYRFGIYKALATRLSLFEAGPGPTQPSPRAGLGFWSRILHGALTRSPFRGAPLVDALVFESERSQALESGRVCPYTDGLVADLQRDGKRVETIDPHADGRHGKEPRPWRRFNDAMALESAFRFRLARWKPGTTDLAVVAEVETFFAATIVGVVRLGWILDPGVRRFLAARATCSRLLRKRQPSEIYCVCAYGGQAPLIAAAKALGIRVTEVQHGMLYSRHFGYRYPVLPRAGRLEYFPDRFLAWILETNHVGVMPCEVGTIPFPSSDRLKRLRAGVVKEKDLMVVLSQPVVASRLAKALSDRRRALERFRLVIKLHPIELADARGRDAYQSLARSGNVSIDDGTDLHSLLARAEYQLGVYSSALYEGLELGCQTLLLPLPGIEHMAELIESNQAMLLDDFLAEGALP